MNDEKTSFCKQLRLLWQGIDLLRRIVLNILFLMILMLGLILLFRDTSPVIPNSSVLVVAPQGNIVEQLCPVGVFNGAKKMVGLGKTETLLKNLLDAIDMAKDDQRIKILFLDLNAIGGADLSKLQELKDAINRFKKSGKKVIAAADNYSRNAYYLAAHADEIYMHHMGVLILNGYSRYKRYYKEGLDRLEVDMNIFRVGKYKSYVEPFTRNTMSAEAKESNLRWLGVLWESYLTDVATARGIKVETLKNYTDQFNTHLKEVNGQTAAMALKAGLIDHASTRDRVRDRLIELVGKDKNTHSFFRIEYKDYLEALGRDQWGEGVRGKAVGVIVAKGGILYGHQPAGTIGGDSTAALIRKARMDENIKALLLRVDSGGGSAFASEIIRREMELARKDGKPVVVSMGSVAASGGYWISLASDEVWASPTTITGSIGILGMFPTFQKPLAKYLGIHVDGVGTNKMAGVLRQDREITPEISEAIRMIIDRGYNEFITLVAKARKKTPGQVHEIAQGRIWIGLDAYKLGLVDHLGGMSDALKSAAKRAKLGQNFRVKYFRKKRTLQQRMISKFFSKITAPGTTEIEVNRPQNHSTGMLHILARQVEILSRFNDPNGLYAYCPYFVE